MRQRIRKDATPPAAIDPKAATIFRLTDMQIEEVSAVDRAANKRKFILVKSASGATSTTEKEVVATATGELVTKAPEPAVPTTPAASTAAPTSPEEAPIPSATNPPEAPLGTPARLSPETKAELVSRIAEAKKQIEKLDALVAGAEEVQGLAEVPQEIHDGVALVVSALNTGVTKAAVEKGRKQISMARESKIRSAATALNEIVAELDAAAPAAEPETPAAPAPAPAAAPTAKADSSTTITPELAKKLVETIERQTAAISKQASRIDQLERGNTRPTPNGATGTELPTTVKKSVELQWPTDMNSPVTGT